MNAKSAIISCLVGAILLAVLTTQPVSAQDTVKQWRRWEKTLVSSIDFTLGGGNPYRDLIFRVQFTPQNADSVSKFVQYAFWEGGTGAAARNFKVRAALPSGTWAWSVVECSGSTGTVGTPPVPQGCSSATWTPSGGTITVVPDTASGVRLYDRGFITQTPCLFKSLPPLSCGWGRLEYGTSHVPFYLAADTAWAAPPRENLTPSAGAWSAFVASRRSKGYTALLIAPTVGWQPGGSDPWPALPAASGFSFDQTGSCSEPIPNDCSKPNPAYWQKFDAMIEEANTHDLWVGIVGVMDPVVLGTASVRFPNEDNAVDFAHYLAARLGGNHVFYSPGFDTRVDALTQDGTTAETVMNSVGKALRKASGRRQLVTNHLAGRSDCPDYQNFASRATDAWMSFYLFQSGHAKAVPNDPGQICPGRLSSESALRAALRRARQMPLKLSELLLPEEILLPALNGEGPYDRTGYSLPPDPVDNRYRLRHANHLSSLSNATGVTYGAERIVFWDDPASVFDLGSSRDMTTLANRFRNLDLSSRPGWILNQRPGQDHENKMVLATDGADVVLAYMPGRQTDDAAPSQNNIRISTTGLPSLNCGGGWTKKWRNAFNGKVNTDPLTCLQGAGQIRITRPSCIPTIGSNPDCDWVLDLKRTSTALSSPFLAATSAQPSAWVEPGSEDRPARLWFELEDSAQVQAPRRLLVAEQAGGFPASPRLARLGTDYLVVWESEPGDGSLRGIFAQRVSAEANKVGPRFQANTYTNQDQSEPEVASDGEGNVVIVWTSFGQDGDQGGIFARRFSPSLAARGSEVQINKTTKGHQERPQIAVDSQGNWLIGWTTRQGEEQPSILSWRKLSAAGQLLTAQQDVVVADNPVQLVDLAAELAGGFRLSWRREDFAGETVALVEQRFDAAGRRLGVPVEVKPRRRTR